jgi:AAA domain
MNNTIKNHEISDPPERKETKAVYQPLEAIPLGNLKRANDNDPDELLKHRFLCRGGTLLLAGPTGIGKSSLAMQLLIRWSIEQGCFGLIPTRPLKILIIQAENDNGDLAEMRDGVLNGLQLTESERQQALINILTYRSDDICGMDFFEKVLKPLVRKYRPDLIVIDPLLAFLGGDVNKQEVVSKWLRNGLNPILRQYSCGCILIHHTNKPPSGREKQNWHAGDLAYLGSGSAELANWSRAVAALRSIGSNDVFEFVLAKRGGRAGWRTPEGEKRYSTFIQHSKIPGHICWFEADQDSVEQVQKGRPMKHTVDDALNALTSDMTTTEWQVRAMENTGMSRAKYFELKKLAIGNNMVSETKAGKWTKNTATPNLA